MSIILDRFRCVNVPYAKYQINSLVYFIFILVLGLNSLLINSIFSFFKAVINSVSLRKLVCLININVRFLIIYKSDCLLICLLLKILRVLLANVCKSQNRSEKHFFQSTSNRKILETSRKPKDSMSRSD